MKVFYDPHTDTLNVILKDNVAVHESDEDKPGIILDYDLHCVLSTSHQGYKNQHYMTAR